MHVPLLVRVVLLRPEAPGVSVLLGRAWPNKGMEPTASSVRCAPASGSGSGLALGSLKPLVLLDRENKKS